uniref:hypothetical protein n=1 Tax=Aquisphaera insulae TaxID=2712864 RepID=UPI0013ECCBDE
MREETRVLLRAMEDWPWFEHVGESISDPGVIAIHSWDEAVEPRRSHVWECLTLQVNNTNYRSVNSRDWHRAQGWNPLVAEVRLVLKPLFGHIEEIGSRLSLPPDAFYHQVTWDLIGIATETEYADVITPLFNVPVLVPWYQIGHFPCGWDGPVLDTDWKGEFPPYRLHVF